MLRRTAQEVTEMVEHGAEPLAVTFDERLVRLALAQRRVRSRQLLPLGEDERGLDVHRLLTPQRSVVVERGNSIDWWHPAVSWFGDGTDE
jgi:hypothetical protein